MGRAKGIQQLGEQDKQGKHSRQICDCILLGGEINLREAGMRRLRCHSETERRVAPSAEVASVGVGGCQDSNPQQDQNEWPEACQEGGQFADHHSAPAKGGNCRETKRSSNKASLHLMAGKGAVPSSLP